jgi:hypothetical protein
MHAIHWQHATFCCISQVSSDETERLVKMEQVLHGRVIGQEEAVTAISRAIRRARVGLKNPNRPIASFIFSGMPWHLCACCLSSFCCEFCCEFFQLPSTPCAPPPPTHTHTHTPVSLFRRPHWCGQVGACQDAGLVLLWL